MARVSDEGDGHLRWYLVRETGDIGFLDENDYDEKLAPHLLTVLGDSEFASRELDGLDLVPLLNARPEERPDVLGNLRQLRLSTLDVITGEGFVLTMSRPESGVLTIRMTDRQIPVYLQSLLPDAAQSFACDLGAVRGSNLDGDYLCADAPRSTLAVVWRLLYSDGSRCVRAVGVDAWPSELVSICRVLRTYGLPPLWHEGHLGWAGL